MAAAVMTAASGRSLLRLTLALAATGLVSSHVVTHRPVRRPELLHVHRRSATVRDVALAPTETPWLTHVIRGAHVAAVAGVVACPAVMDAAAGAVWHGYSALSFTGHPMFEACWAVTVFVLSIAFYESLHMFWPGAVRHRLDGAPPRGAMHGFTRLSHLHKTVVPAASYLGSIFVWHKLRMGRLLFGIPAGGWAAGAPSFVRIAVELLLGVWMYDLLFYPFHLAMHKLRIPKVRRLHSRHHRWAAQEGEGSAHIAVETVQNSYLDAGVQVFINICVQQLSPFGHKHPLSRALHNFAVPYLLCEAHSGYDLPFMSHRVWPALFGGAPRHEQHHQRGGIYFHQFFKYLDDAFGHTPETQARAQAQREARRREARRREVK